MKHTGATFLFQLILFEGLIRTLTWKSYNEHTLLLGQGIAPVIMNDDPNNLPILNAVITSPLIITVFLRFIYPEKVTKIFIWTYTLVKFIYSEKATKFCEIFPSLLTTVHTVKSKGKISQNFVAFSEYMNFKWRSCVQNCA